MVMPDRRVPVPDPTSRVKTVGWSVTVKPVAAFGIGMIVERDCPMRFAILDYPTLLVMR